MLILIFNRKNKAASAAALSASLLFFVYNIHIMFVKNTVRFIKIKIVSKNQIKKGQLMTFKRLWTRTEERLRTSTKSR